MIRIEKVVRVFKDREFSEKYPGFGWAFDFEDEEGNRFEWNTTTIPDESIIAGQTWLVRMTLKTNHDVIGYKYTRVERVNFIKQII